MRTNGKGLFVGAIPLHARQKLLPLTRMRQYLYFCTSKASKLHTWPKPTANAETRSALFFGSRSNLMTLSPLFATTCSRSTAAMSSMRCSKKDLPHELVA